MDKQKLKHYKNLLLEERADVLDTIDRMNHNEPNASLQEYFDELSTYDNHPADIATETFMMEQNFNLKNVELLRLREIDISLEKIKNETYGNCDICGKEIPDERLETIPEAKICMTCANDKINIDEMKGYRPVEEENLEVPYARTFKDNADDQQVAFDGEDSWQAVARYNEVPNDPSNTTMDNMGIFDDEDPGSVEAVENISEGFYKGQLEGQNREDIPDEQRKDMQE